MAEVKSILFLTFLFLVGCSSSMCPDKTSVTYGTTDVDADNDNKNKTQEKKSIPQTWKWGKENCK